MAFRSTITKLLGHEQPRTNSWSQLWDQANQASERMART
jgi:hypothetical protein